MTMWDFINQNPGLSLLLFCGIALVIIEVSENLGGRGK